MKRLLRSLVVASALSSAGVLASPPSPPPPPATEQQADRPVLDVVFALDTTGSMGGS